MLNLLYFLLILGIIIFVHELGHFIFSKRAGIYVYEFALGMGPKLYSFKRKNDETVYSIRAIPLGGFVSLAGEDNKVDKKVPKSKLMTSKSWMQRFLSVIAGVIFNFIFAIIVLFVMGLIYGAPEIKPIIGGLEEGYPAYESGLEAGDIITSMDGSRVRTWDDVLINFEMKSNDDPILIEVLKASGEKEEYTVDVVKLVEEDYERYIIGIELDTEINRGIWVSIKYAFTKFASIVVTMAKTIWYLITGSLAIGKISGPVGIYSIVGDRAAAGFDSMLYLLAFLSINVGFINFLPIPAFDGGRILFLIIEKIKGKPVNPKTEGKIHTVGFVILIGLMILVTINDIIKLIF